MSRVICSGLRNSPAALRVDSFISRLSSCILVRRSSPLEVLQALELLAHLLAGLLGELLGLLDLLVVELQLFLDALVAEQHAEVAEAAEASALTLRGGGTGEHGHQAQTEEGCSTSFSWGRLLRGSGS